MKSRWCRQCRRRVVAYWQWPAVGWHVLLIFLTLGLWIPVAFVMTTLRKRYRCGNCGLALR